MGVLVAGICLLVTPLVVYVAVSLARPDPKPLYGVYAVPGRWFAVKYLAARLLLGLARRRTPHARRRAADPALIRPRHDAVAELDSNPGIGDHPYGHNSFYVNGSDRSGTTRLIARVAIRPRNKRDVWFLLRLPDLGDLVLPIHPHCLVTVPMATTNIPGDGFAGGGLDCSVIEPLKKWRISYNGPCRVGIRSDWEETDTRPTVHLRCSFIWTSMTSFYDFTMDVHPRLSAHNIAKEKWTKELFEKLKSLKQIHFEQFGELRGVVQVDDGKERELVLTGVKDRSEGPRRWSDMRSYILNFIILDDGRFLHVGAFCFPGVASSMTSGFVIQPTGEIIPAVSVDLPLADLMEKTENPPMTFCFSMQTEDGVDLNIETHIDEVMYFNMDHNWSVKIREGLSWFTVNGVPGMGVCEILKRYHGGCPIPTNEAETSI